MGARHGDMAANPITRICCPGVVELVRSNLGISFPLFHGRYLVMQSVDTVDTADTVDSPVSTELNEQNNTNHSQKMAGSIITRETLCVDSGLSYLHARFKCSNPAWVVLGWILCVIKPRHWLPLPSVTNPPAPHTSGRYNDMSYFCNQLCTCYKIQNHLDIQNSVSWTLSSKFRFTWPASRQLQPGKSMLCAWPVVDKSVICAELYPRILVPGSLREKLYCVTTTNLLGGPDIGCSFFVCCQNFKNNILN